MPRKKTKWIPDYIPTDYEQEAYLWGVSEGIIISPIGTKKENEYRIGISFTYTPANIKTSPESYEGNEVWKKVYEYYIWYYEKRTVSS